MLFTVLNARSNPPSDSREKAFLVRDNWNDWGKYQTQFFLYVSDENGTLHDIGSVKIGEMGLQPDNIVKAGSRSPSLQESFESLDNRYFSVGQSETYYEALNQLSKTLQLSLLKGLRDCAYDSAIFNMAEQEDVMAESLLRSVSRENVLNRFHRLASGDAKLTEFQFAYTLPPIDLNAVSPRISFLVSPKSEPPTNVHVLIGRNGVGKTRCIQSMASAICSGSDGAEEFGSFERLGINRDDWSFAGLIFVSFSAFDSFLLPQSSARGLKAAMVGLRHSNDNDTKNETSIVNRTIDPRSLTIKTPNELANDFCSSFGKCRTGLRAERWLSAVKTLGNDPLFADAGISELLEAADDEWPNAGKSLFGRLSSGHAIVLLTITRLVELVDERTFVIVDEPEGHLHPPLLSTLIRAISDLLISRNGVALIATHSPVVLQEVPKSCVWILQRSGNTCAVERPPIETFGENVGFLTSTVFGLEVTSSGFHQLLKQAVENGNITYEMVLSHFGEQLGAEAKALVRSILDSRQVSNGEEP